MCPKAASASFTAAPAPTAIASSEPGAVAMLNFRGVLRDLRAEAQDLTAALVQIRERSELEDAATRATELKAALEQAQGVFERNRQRINELLGQVRQIFQQQAVIYDWCSDEVTHLENAWERLGDNWPEENQVEGQLFHNIDAAKESLDKMSYLCGQLTIPPRLNQHLASLRIGQALDFHRNFRDELENDADRARLLGYLADHPYIVDGVVDTENGVVYRASRKSRRRLLSYVMLLAVTGLGFGLVYVMANLGTWLGLDNWQANGFASLTATYIFLLLGAVAHLLVDAVKKSRENNGAALLAVRDWLLWVHIKESVLIMGVLYIWIGLIGLAFTVNDVPWMTAFFVGYSIDSFVDLFLQRFSQAVSAQTTAITEHISKGGGSS